MLTKLEQGIFVYIDAIQLEMAIQLKGWLDKENYPDKYKELSLDNEVGRFGLFRFLLKD